MRKNLLVSLALIVCLGFSTYMGFAQTLFEDDFEGDLSLWVGKSGGAHSGVIVADPIRPGNNVLVFSSLRHAGDVYGSEVPVTPGVHLVLEFEYLGLPGPGGRPGNLGGTIGIAEDTPGGHRWFAGTTVGGGIEQDLMIDDGQWRTYSIEFDPGDPGCCGYDGSPTNNTIRVMLEDWAGSGGVSGDAFFDNIRLRLASIVVDVEIIPKRINPYARGVIPVAVLGSENLDILQIDVTTLGFGPAEASCRHDLTDEWTCNEHVEDMNLDGFLDLMTHYRAEDTGIACGDSSATITGSGLDGTPFVGIDYFETVGCNSNRPPRGMTNRETERIQPQRQRLSSEEQLHPSDLVEEQRVD
jgi:hypothetical protein